MDQQEEELLSHVAAGTDIWTAIAATSEDERPPKSGANEQPEPQQAGDNPHSLKVIGEEPPPKPDPGSKRPKRDAG